MELYTPSTKKAKNLQKKKKTEAQPFKETKYNFLGRKQKQKQQATTKKQQTTNNKHQTTKQKRQKTMNLYTKHFPTNFMGEGVPRFGKEKKKNGQKESFLYRCRPKTY